MRVDYLGLNAALYEWADSYDSKDWDRLRKCIAPTLRVRPSTSPSPSSPLPQQTHSSKPSLKGQENNDN